MLLWNVLGAVGRWAFGLQRRWEDWYNGYIPFDWDDDWEPEDRLLSDPIRNNLHSDF